MADLTVESHGDWISLASGAGTREGLRLTLTPSEAEQAAFQLLGAAALVRSTMNDEAQTAIRRGQQQIITALQEVARKVARHEQLVTTTSATINASADLEHALAKGLHTQGEIRQLWEASFPC